MIIDVNEIREIEANMQGISVCNDVLTFYYDETGNCRKFSLTEDGVNAPDAMNNNFILGGIAFDGVHNPADYKALFTKLRLQNSIKELKFCHIYGNCKGFLEFMDSNRISDFLKWLNQSGLFIHYCTINNWYYALVDIVDSLWEAQPQFCFSFEWVLALKSALYQFTLQHKEEMLSLLQRFMYPAIPHEKSNVFCSEFCQIIRTYNDGNDPERGFQLEVFQQMLKYSGKHGELSFLHGNEPWVLVKDYYTLYLGRCYTYKNAHHNFDEEKTVEAELKKIILMDTENRIENYRFLESVSEPYIQISDVVVGLLAKLFTYVDNISVDETFCIATQLSEKQQKNFNIVDRLLSRAESRHLMLIQNANDAALVRTRMQKLQILATSKT